MLANGEVRQMATSITCDFSSEKYFKYVFKIADSLFHQLPTQNYIFKVNYLQERSCIIFPLKCQV